MLLGKSLINRFQETDEFGPIGENDGLISVSCKESWPSITTSAKFRVNLQIRWTNCLILKLLGKYIGLKALDERIRKMWMPKTEYELIDVGEDSTAVWIRFPGLPIHYYNEMMLFDMGNTLDCALKVDAHTSYASKGRKYKAHISKVFSKPSVPSPSGHPISCMIKSSAKDNSLHGTGPDKVRALSMQAHLRILNRLEGAANFDIAIDAGSRAFLRNAKDMTKLHKLQILVVVEPRIFDEVRSALFMKKPWKAPCDDGFHAGVYQICGVSAPESVKQLRPISLCTVAYKLITKVIVNRLWPLLNDLVNPLQSSFIPGRQAVDNILIAQEVLHKIKRFKLNYEKFKFYVSSSARLSSGRYFAQILNLSQSPDLGKYLGVPLIHGRVSKVTYNELVDKVKERLSSWKSNTLSIAGRVTLVRKTEQRVPHLVAWDEVCKLKRVGGLELRSMAKCPNVDPTLVDDSTRVCDFITRDFEWDTNKLFALHPMETAVKIIGYPLPKFSPVQDKNIWKYSSNGVFTTQSAYLALTTVPPDDQTPHLNWLWSLPILPKWKFFMWLAWPKNFWNHCIERSQRGQFYVMDLRKWLHENLATSRNSHAPLIRFASAIWNFWKERCQRNFQPKDYVYDESRTWLQIASPTNKMLQLNHNYPKNTTSTLMVHWSSPSNGYLKLNTDGVSQGNPGIARADGLLRDENGAWVMGFAAHLGTCTSVTAELFAIRMGLSLAWKYGYYCVFCEVDAKLALNLINNCHSSLHPLGSLIEDIRSFKARNWILMFQHIHREDNFCANILSKLGCSLEDDRVIFSSSPTEVSRMLEADSRGVSFPIGFSLQ
ncbi:hypothetical protein F3Y22_tig00000778pilonHSYRG00265 [Hibiscus syriacus]|uniref:RNase H type-1 domain-containing protein n=1 Tax=Hibiscus syriacus TaxID=106335 RepID=A0A6A3CX57_HIBSY|nr:hypothetical protein F3Y22_tig00000778pilonHSYRG00265 [Hibiscus syriacus]